MLVHEMGHTVHLLGLGPCDAQKVVDRFSAAKASGAYSPGGPVSCVCDTTPFCRWLTLLCCAFIWAVFHDHFFTSGLLQPPRSSSPPLPLS